ncbi:hypothetical protein G7013_17415 [Pseudomonas viridiflava]|uniref:hypothetical protein n=1 Tax=Pseudomonas viridiflava TaxID=33069 RepID=UPI0015E35B42|nr:hypothetical protein [Pseudomonas viridiflava]MBA1231432.1 hypothetical protein [Pseudomonas viridiflava]
MLVLALPRLDRSLTMQLSEEKQCFHLPCGASGRQHQPDTDSTQAPFEAKDGRCVQTLKTFGFHENRHFNGNKKPT